MTQLYTTSFPSDGALPISENGQTWTNRSGSGISVSGNKLTATTGITIATCPCNATSTADVLVEATFSTMPAAGLEGVVARYNTSTNDHYLLTSNGNTQLQVYKNVSGSYTQVGASYTGLSLANGDKLGLQISGSIITAFLNGSSLGTRTDSAISAAGDSGVRFDTSGTVAVSVFTVSDLAPSASFTVTPTAVPNNHAGNITLTLVGSGTSWSGSTVLTPSGVANVTKVSQNVTSPTTATVVITTGAGTGTLTITETVTGSASATTTVAASTLALAPSSVFTGGTYRLKLTGTNTVWSQETAASLFTLSGGTGASSGSITVSSNTVAYAVLVAGSGVATLTVADASVTGISATTSAVAATTGAPGDTNVYFSPNAWVGNSTAALGAGNVGAKSTRARTNLAGAYIKVAFTGTGITLNYTNAPYAIAADYPTLLTSLDDGAWTAHQLTSGEAGAWAIASGLTDTAHTLQLMVKCWNGSADRWAYAQFPDAYATAAVLDIAGFTITGASPATSAPTLRTKTAIFFGDSITEGVHAAEGDFFANDAHATWCRYVADALDCEYAHVGFNGQRLTSGSTPPGLRGGTGASKSWDKHDANLSRLVSGALSPSPDYCFVMIGTNDGLNAVANATVTAAAGALLSDLNTANPNMKVFLVLPPGRFCKTALSAATLPANCFYKDLGPEMAAGLSNNTVGDGSAAASVTTNRHSSDGLHPNNPAHAEIAARLVKAAQDSLVISAATARRVGLTGGM